MEDNQERIASLVAELRAEGYRLTPQRRAILKALIGNQNHPSVEELYQSVRPQYPQLSLATVYNLVNLLKERGDIIEVKQGDAEAHYDGFATDPHPHLICIKCGAIMDVELFDAEWFVDIEQEVVQETGYHIIDHTISFLGVCPGCQQESIE